jgi:hypothetical protein
VPWFSSRSALHGNAAITAILTAPLTTVTLGGGGSSGYFVGAIRALNVSDQGGYPMHYDVQVSRLDGVMGQAIVSSYARIKQWILSLFVYYTPFS